MTPDEIQTKGELFRDMALAVFQEKARAKYDKGQAEHKDFLPGRSLGDLLDMMEEEVIDMVFYMASIRYHLKDVGLTDIKETE